MKGPKRCELQRKEKVRYLKVDYLSTSHPIETTVSLLSPLGLPLYYSPRFMPIFICNFYSHFHLHFPYFSRMFPLNLNHHFPNPAITSVQCSYPTPHVDVSPKPFSRYGPRPPREPYLGLLIGLFRVPSSVECWVPYVLFFSSH